MFIAALAAFLRRIPAWFWVAGVFLLAGWYYGHAQYQAGERATQFEWDAQKAKDAAEIAHLKEQAGKVTVMVETRYVDRIKTIKVKGDTIVKKVPIYISRDLPELPPAFRWLHDAAATGVIPGPAVPADVAAVAPQDVAATVADNYTTCLATSEQLKGLQEWVTEQKRLNQ